jgi:hypothetical protein
MINHDKQKALTAMLKKQMHIKLLVYYGKATSLPDSSGSRTKKQIPLFYDKPIYKSKKHELF